MKKTFLILFVFIFFLTLLFFFKRNPCKNSKAKIYQINSKNYCLLTADNQEQWERGLMFYKKPVDFDGMIFIFSDKRERRFWNKNTYLDLDIYWLDENMVVGKVFLPSIEKSKETVTIDSSKAVNKVIEIIK